MAALAASFSRLSVAQPSQSLSFSASMRASPLTAARVGAKVAVQVFTVQAKQNSLKRIRTSEKRRLYNKSLKSEIFTRSKKAFLEIDALEKKGVSAETEFAKAEKLISEAMGVIDSAKVKGVLHSNTADRRKSKLARYKTRALERLGLYTPAN